MHRTEGPRRVERSTESTTGDEAVKVLGTTDGARDDGGSSGMGRLPLDGTKVRRESHGVQRRTAYRQQDDVERQLLGAERLDPSAGRVYGVARRFKESRG